MWLYFQMYFLRMSLALALCNPHRHAPIMKGIHAAWNNDNQRDTHVTGLRVFAFQCVRSHW